MESICRPRLLAFKFLFCIRSKFAVSLVASTLQNQNSMVLSLRKTPVLCFTSHGRSIITRIRERNFEGLLKIKNIACGVFLERIMPNENEGGATFFTSRLCFWISVIPYSLCHAISIVPNIFGKLFFKINRGLCNFVQILRRRGIWNECFYWPDVVSFLHGIMRSQAQGKEAFWSLCLRLCLCLGQGRFHGEMRAVLC